MKLPLRLHSSTHTFVPPVEKPGKKQGHQLFKNPILGWCLAFLFFVTAGNGAFAQDVLVGLTSNGGTGGGGTAFSLKTSGTNFMVHRNFLNAGTSPHGDLIKGFDGNFYGMVSYSDNGYGTIIKMTPAGAVTVLKRFDNETSGTYPYGSLVQGKDSIFYGMTSSGGTGGSGTIFKITAAGKFTVLKNFTDATGYAPYGSLVQGTDGLLYGMTNTGGNYGYGTIFKITTSGTLTVLKHLDGETTGGNPQGNLVQGSDGAFYGMTNNGGTAENGTIFKITSSGTITVLKNLDYYTMGGYPNGSLVKGTDGAFYGMTNTGGTYVSGTIFKITSAGAFTIIKQLNDAATGSFPEGSLVQGSDGAFYGMTRNGGTNNEGTIFKVTAGGTFTVLRHLKNATDGSRPYGSLCRNSDGFFYGMTFQGGSSVANSGTIFKISAAGAFTVLNRLPDNSQGIAPQESLVQATDGFFYGTATLGGTTGAGAVYKLCTDGSFTVLRSLTQASGSNPNGSLVQAADSNFYGTTYRGGTNNMGTIFKITPAGTYTVLKNLSAATGSFPEGSLTLGTDGALYGMTTDGGTAQSGTIFKITTAGTYTVLKNLDAFTTGGYPKGSLVLGADGAFYGMTSEGGTNGEGTIFKITTAGSFTVLKHLSNSTGHTPNGNLIKGADGLFYGVTTAGGSTGNGTIFKITATGTLTVLKNFDGTTTGGKPQGSLVQGSDGTLYGMTAEGGTYKGGTIFKITTTGTFTVLRHLNPATDGNAPYGSLIIQKQTPVVKAQSVTTAEDVAKAITFTVTGNTPQTYTISTAPRNGTLSGTGSTRTYKSNANFYGKDSFYVTATWGCQTSAPTKINITVTAVNDAPVLAAIGNKSVVKGTMLTFTATATDVDAGQTKTFSLITPPSGATINATSGVFSWKPAVTGTFAFKVRVTDNGSPVLYDEKTITVTVKASALVNTTVMTMAATPAVTEEHANALNATLYPNPVTDRFTVTLNAASDMLTATVLDMKGAVLLTKQYTASKQVQLDASSLKPGQYLVQLQTKQGRVVLQFIKL